MTPAQKYRRKAAQAKRLAQSVSDDLVREQLEMMAKDYEEMADQLEGEAAPDGSGPGQG